MIIQVTGYEEKKPGEDEEIPKPESLSWTCEIERVGESLDGRSMQCTLRIDDRVVGMIRLPNNEYLTYFRNLLTKE